MVSLVPLEITIRNKVPIENLLAGTSFLTLIFRGPKRNPIF
jgi:hypothetical protein